MTIPPFPSQDLAKLVLGYLAEEQLMTAYDEFLQASPYLDALRNEYDRIFMTSLKNILAEYRAVKIYVETCKPLSLRKKLVQCTNLLDVVKYLANNVDIHKIQAQDISSDKISHVKQSTSISKQSACDVCNSLNLSSCACKKQKTSFNSPSYDNTSSPDKSVETTALEDLPGNHGPRKKHVKVLEKESLLESNICSGESTKQSSNTPSNSGNGLITLNSNSQSSQIKLHESSSLSLSAIVKVVDTPECREKIEEFNSILNKVCKSKEDTTIFNIPKPENIHKSVSNDSTFQEFASGVCGRENRNVPVPDSSTSENSVVQTLAANDTNRHTCSNINDVPGNAIENSGIRPYTNYPYPRIKSKCKDQKIKIISDIKVDRPFTNLNNATSTPLMQTIVINGTPAYKQKLPVISNNYTKDEIMAMPTLIVVPVSGPPPTLNQSKPVVSQKTYQHKTKTVSSAKILGPLVIDVSSSKAAPSNKDDANQASSNPQNPAIESGLVKTVDHTKNASVPKDNVITCSHQTNTPQVLPPVRKSSSTPRRNSHIRVLDFTTPRRILHETINEIVTNETGDKPVEIDARGPNLIFSGTDNSENNIVDMRNVKVHKIETCHISNITRDSDIKQQTFLKKSNWDADLRALAIASDKTNGKTQPTKSKPRTKKPKKPTEPPVEKHEETDKTQEKKVRSKRKLSPKVRKSKKQKKLEEEEAQYAEATATVETKASVKPIFNVLPAEIPYSQKEDKQGIESNENKSNTDDNNETPEAERLSLQNEIGSRLNISEFLETPYKQVLYDIQMETPKFLGSVLPDEPISDIKIMSIPTPRFFDTPKPAHATPSSYSSRPTDYSSGGSYYKPDDQDYLRIPEIECPVTSSKDEPHVGIPEDTASSSKRSSRPVRKCTKNVSYVNTCNKAKEKNIDEKSEIASNLSDSTSINSSFENKDNISLKTPKVNKSKLLSKSETKKRLDSSKKRKTPTKKDKLNSFMKIKPRRPTPTKDKNKRTRRKTDVYSQNSSFKHKERLKGSGKEKNAHVSAVVVPAQTKSRRKSSTPRKIHCTKPLTSESSGLESPENNASASVVYKDNVTKDPNLVISNDSDTEHIALRWSDDGSQDAKAKDGESEDISKIKEYIETSVNCQNKYSDKAGPLHVDLIKRGFDAETAKIIERDLLDTPPFTETNRPTYVDDAGSKKEGGSLEKSVESDTSGTNDLQIVQDDETDDIELSVYECHEESNNYLICTREAKDISKEPPSKLKDKFCMEVCIDDGVAIRLRATDFNMLFDNSPKNEAELGYSFRETEVAVSSISNIERLYTPLKDHKAQCFEIFDSTLTSLDTPLKLNSPKHMEQKVTEIEIVLEEEKVDSKDKTEIKKKKRLLSSKDSEEVVNESKITKPEPQYLFHSNIQNIDIESVLTKLHGP